MKIFIIGGAGYIGSHMVKIAHQAGHDVITVDNLSTGHQDAVLYGDWLYRIPHGQNCPSGWPRCNYR